MGYNQNPGVTLRVQEAKYRDVGRGIARIPRRYMKELQIEAADVVEITGRRGKTTVIVWPAYPEDEDRDHIRIDGTTRANAGARLDDRVQVKKAEVAIARTVTLAPSGKYVLRGAEKYFKRELEGRPISVGDKIRLESMGRVIVYIVTSVSPSKDSVVVQTTTEIKLREKPEREKDLHGVPRTTYEDIGGLDEEIQRIREMVELPMRYPELFERLGVEPPRGVLLHGPPGTGKTMLAKAVATESEAYFVYVSGPEIMSKFYGESEKKIREIFEEASKNAPSVIFIDEVDSIAPKREDASGEVERRVVAQILSLMDGLEARGQVIVIGATNRVNAIDPALRRPGRFDREVEIGVPDKNGRKEVLEIHTRSMPVTEDFDIDRISQISHGFVGADLAALAKESAMRSIRRIIPDIIWGEAVSPEILEKVEVTMDDFRAALAEIEPSAMREVYVEIPDVKWEDVGAMENAKQELREAVEWPLKFTEIFEYTHTEAPKGILLFGSPGTGKTLLVKALANETELNFISIKGSEVLSKWVGESEKAIRETFRKARQAAPCIVFFDELDALTPYRGSQGDSGATERVISSLLTEIDGLEELKNVIVIGATNRPDIIDPALLRQGRFDRLIYIPPPDQAAREAILRVHLRGKPLEKTVKISELAQKTEGYTGADIQGVVREATMLSIREFVSKNFDIADMSKENLQTKLQKNGPQVTMAEFEGALKKVRPGFNAKKQSVVTAAEEFARGMGLI